MVLVEKDIQEQLSLSTNRELATFLFLSFRFSQGHKNLQQDLFCYLKMEYPMLEIDNRLSEELRRETTRMALKYLTGRNEGKYHKPIIETPSAERMIVNVVAEEISGLTAVFSTHQNKGKRELIESITRGIIEQDRFMLTERGIRQRQASPPGLSSNPFLSHFRHYVLGQNPTGSLIFDKMFQEAKEVWDSDLEKESRIPHELVKTWEHHHPGQKFFQ